MTMPYERTRALRFGWEFLLELRDSDYLTGEQRVTVENILRHYPSGAEIKQWARECVQSEEHSMFLGPDLAPEDEEPGVGVQYPGTLASSAKFARGPTTPKERAHALWLASEFFRFGLAGSKNDNLPENLRRQIPFVLRHFPTSADVVRWRWDR